MIFILFIIISMFLLSNFFGKGFRLKIQDT